MKLKGFALVLSLLLFVQPLGMFSVGAEGGHKATFELPDNATVLLYDTQDYTADGTECTGTAIAKNSDTGVPALDGDDQVNFQVVPDEGYVVDTVTVAPDGNYKNLKELADTELKNGYRITKITGDITVTVTVKSAQALAFKQDYHAVGEAVEITKNGLPDGCEIQWYSGDTYRTTGETYTLTEADLCSFITVKAVSGGSVVASDSFWFSNIPVVNIDVENGEQVLTKEYYDATMKITGNSADDMQYDGEVEIKGRGNSTWFFAKKPYKLKLGTSTNLFGMGKNKHWVLLANYLDESLMRTATASYISQKLGIVTMKTIWVDLVVNGEYYGNYQLCEHVRIDDKRVPIYNWEDAAEEISEKVYDAHRDSGMTSDDADSIKDLLETDFNWITTDKFTYNGKTYTVSDYYEIPENILQGILLEVSYEYDEISKFRTKDNAPVMVNSPEYLGTNTEIMTKLQNHIQLFEDAVMSPDKTVTIDGKKVSYTEFVDYDSLISLSLVSLFMKNEIGYKSTYLYLDENSKLNFGPAWDFDSSSGASTPWGTGNAKGWQIWDACTWYQYFIDDPVFALKFREKYLEMRPYFVELTKTGGLLDTWYQSIHASATVNSAMWESERRQYCSENQFEYRNFETDFSHFKYWVKDRINWMDGAFATQTDALHAFYQYPSTGMQLIPDESAFPTDKNADYAMSYGDVDITIDAMYYNGVALYVNGAHLGDYYTNYNRTTVTVPKELLWTDQNNVISVRDLNNLNNVNSITIYTKSPCADGHTPAVSKAVDATCSKTGLTEGTYCSVCLAVLTEQAVTPKQPHNEERVPAKAATCTEAGYTEGSYCLDCFEPIKDSSAIPVAGHKSTLVGVKAATHFENGYTGDKTCSVCGEVEVSGEEVAKLKLAIPKASYKPKKKGITVKYTQSKSANKLQVRYKLKGKKKWTVKTFKAKALKKVTKTVKKLKSGKKYTAQVRAMKTAGKKKAYSSWTKQKTVKVK